MDETPQKRPWNWRSIFREPLPLRTETMVFILVSALDIFATYLLLRRGHREANPVANFFYRQWGMDGMVAFKFVMVAFVAVICQVIARRRPQTARAVLIFACLVVGAVVVYSLVLLARSLGY